KGGDKIPERLWRLPLCVVHSSDINDTITLEKYRDRSLFVIDFWSVWCAPCIQSMQKWEEMLTQIDSRKIAFLGALVFDQPYKAQPFINWKNWNSWTAIGKNAHILNRCFFNRFVNSRAIWIKDGKLLAITGTTGYGVEELNAILQGKEVN